jgi:hypothetical protein
MPTYVVHAESLEVGDPPPNSAENLCGRQSATSRRRCTFLRPVCYQLILLSPGACHGSASSSRGRTGNRGAYKPFSLLLTHVDVAQDAYVLSRILSDTNNANLGSQIHLIAQTYDTIRRPIGNATLVMTKKYGKLSELTDDEKELPFVKAHDDKVPHEVLMAYMNKSQRCRKILWDTSDGVEEQCQNALKLLRSLAVPESKM